MDISESWKQCFTTWPDDLPRRGVLVTNYDEEIQFSSFMISPTMLLVERKSPDAVGTRQVIIPYANIVALKITDVVKVKAFRDLGFVGKLTTA